jgi:hypothetical protein
MANPGQPTLYRREYCELAHYCLLGATNELLGDFFGFARGTIQTWIATRPDFLGETHGLRPVGETAKPRTDG